MTNKKIYNFFLFMSTLTRSLVEVFSVVLLYDKGYTIHDILLFLLVMYLMGIAVNYFSLIINYKVVLGISILLYGVSYLYLSIMKVHLISLILFALLFAIGNYSYHAIRHYLALKLMTNKNKVIKDNNHILFVTYVSTILANILGILLIKKLPIVLVSMVIMVLSVISVVPVFKLKGNHIKNYHINLREVKISKNKVIFSILEQFKVILMELQPLFLYLYVKSSFNYIGIFNIVINFASLLVMMFISRRVSNKYFKYFNIVLGIVLILKINIKNSFILLGIAFLEGVGIKLYEKFSLDNLYDLNENHINSYLIVEEIIFFVSKSFIMFLFILFIPNIQYILYVCIIGLIVSGFYIKD